MLDEEVTQLQLHDHSADSITDEAALPCLQVHL